MIKLADSKEAIVVIPIVAKPVEVEVEVTLGVVPVEIGHMAITIRVNPGRAVKMYKISSIALPFEYSRGCILFENFISPIFYTKFIILKYRNSTLSKALALFILAYLIYLDFNRPKP
ncbi:MAG: hypothetical protein Q7J14_01465 [Candidatus Magasanikbacteria bacterium]|nr:hypothetical protein [Candidatus Magasanikbacteria bacterium]